MRGGGGAREVAARRQDEVKNANSPDPDRDRDICDPTFVVCRIHLAHGTKTHGINKKAQKKLCRVPPFPGTRHRKKALHFVVCSLYEAHGTD